ncbi:hypothetical protein BGX33_007495 [Mortierella sp. NVP41]|nr:hypothetical protein BGX33_007495 [Mortierella sp. NVP41]
MSNMIKWVTLTLAKYAPAKAGSFVCRSIVDPEGTASEFLTLQVASEADVRATCRHGGTLPDGKTVRFVPYSSEAQAQQQGRVIQLSSMVFNTKASNVISAMGRVGVGPYGLQPYHVDGQCYRGLQICCYYPFTPRGQCD